MAGRIIKTGRRNGKDKGESHEREIYEHENQDQGMAFKIEKHKQGNIIYHPQTKKQ